ncbi:MAG TPA: YXWGXW repeat-containing protein [Kofleriaceae bacterium]|nr:YXWGXW repeat-containing protein [Kofleriaceae bacterium]
MRFIELRRLTLVAALAFGCLAGEVSASAQQGEVVIRTAPPAPRYEARTRGPAGYEWAPGYWRWERGHYAWIPGHWQAPRRGLVWQPARWERRYNGWVFIPGRFVRAGRYNPPPPAPRPNPPRPAPDYGNGYWERQGWVLLGEQWVSGNQDHDFIPVGRREGQFSRITLVARNSDFVLHDVVITYSNGRAWSPRLNHYFREGQRSRTLIFPNGPRSIRSIKLLYGNLPGGGRALVQVWAR